MSKATEDITSYDAYLKNRLEFIKRHSVYGANINEAELKARQKEIAKMYEKQDKYVNVSEYYPDEKIIKYIEENTNNEEN